MINRVIFQGNLVHNPDFRNTPSGANVCKLSVANNRRYGEKEETTFIDVTVWGKSAEYCRNYLAKGSQVLIEGRLTMETWQGKDGSNRSKIAIVAENIQGLNRNNNNSGNNNSGNAPAPAASEERGQYRQMDAQYAPPSQHDIDKGNGYQPQMPDMDDMPF
jgi:single-strand DNA-binding protein